MSVLDSNLKWRRSQWPAIYEARFAVFGNTMTMVPFGDSFYGQVDATTFLGRLFNASGLAPTWTTRVSGNATAPYSFATPLNLTRVGTTSPPNWQGLCPVLMFNGSTENMDTPDANYWTNGNGANDTAFSGSMWIYPTTVAANMALWSKIMDAAPTQQEWLFHISSAGLLTMTMYDDSVPATIRRSYSVSLSANRWYQVGWTYDGTAAATGIKLYLNGSAVDDTTTTSGVYVAMENKTELVRISGYNSTGPAVTWFYQGGMAGGPMGPAYAQIALTAAQMDREYQIGRGVLGL